MVADAPEKGVCEASTARAKAETSKDRTTRRKADMAAAKNTPADYSQGKNHCPVPRANWGQIESLRRRDFVARRASHAH